MRAWLAHHRRALGATLAKIAGAPLGIALSALVIGIALSLPLGLYALLSSLGASPLRHSGEPQLSAFLALDASRGEIAHVEGRLKQHAQVRAYRFVARDQALRELKEASGLDDIVDTLPQNPLPDAFVISARPSEPAALEALRDEIRQWPRVAHVQLDSAWARRLDAALRLGQAITVLLGAVLALTLAGVAFNTIRLQILTRLDEIRVVKLIGATDAFIRRPFLYFGAVQGFASGLVAWLAVTGGTWLVNRNLAELSRAYSTLFQLQHLETGDVAALLAFATVLGWAGAWLSVRRHLASVESPR